MESAKDTIFRTLSDVKAFLGQNAPPRLNEADTRAFFIDPIVKALGWDGIGVVTREYHVRSSGEYIDYVGSGPDRRLLAIEAKPLQTDLTDKHAAQLIQYCAVEGIEWAALTNGRELQFFNRYLKGDITEQRIMKLDLLDFENLDDFNVVFVQVWQLSREGITTPSGTRHWLHKWRIDAWLRQQLLTADSPSIQHIREGMAEADINASPQELLEWFRTHLASGAATLHGPAKPVVPSSGTRATAHTAFQRLSDDAQVPVDKSSPVEAIDPAPSLVSAGPRKSIYFGVKLRELVDIGLLPPGTPLVLGTKDHTVATATVSMTGAINYDDRQFESPSDKTFARLLGRQSLNGWTSWTAQLPDGPRTLSQLRDQLIQTQPSSSV